MTKTFCCLIIALLLISLMTSGCIEIKEDPEGITAKEGLNLAEEVASDWSENATLVIVNKGSSMVSKGSFTAWGYGYYHMNESIESGRDKFDLYTIRVYSDMTFESRETLNTTARQSPIYNWNKDSDEAYEIAMENESIKEFLSEYSRASVSGFTLFGGEGGSDPAWKIHWSSMRGFADPKHAEIRINARNGEVIEVDASSTP